MSRVNPYPDIFETPTRTEIEARMGKPIEDSWYEWLCGVFVDFRTYHRDHPDKTNGECIAAVGDYIFGDNFPDWVSLRNRLIKIP